MKSRQVDAWLRHQGGQASDEVQGFLDDVGGAVPVQCLERIAHIPLTRQGHAFGRYRRAGDVSAQPLQLSSLVRLCCETGME